MFNSTSSSGLGTIVGLTTQINALQQAMSATTDPAAKALLQAQIAMLTSQLTAEAQHQQSQADSASNILNGLELFNTLNSIVGTSAPTIINLFRR